MSLKYSLHHAAIIKYLYSDLQLTLCSGAYVFQSQNYEKSDNTFNTKYKHFVTFVEDKFLKVLTLHDFKFNLGS